MIRLTDLLLEYSNKTINDTFERWKKEGANLNIDEVKAMLTRFDQIKNNIDQKVKAGTLSIPEKFIKPDKKTKKILDHKDINNWTARELEGLIDNYGSKEKKTDKVGFYTVQEADLVEVKGVPLVYSDSNINIYEGSTYDSCIKLNYAFKFKDKEDKIYTYGFCIGRKEDYANQYYKYRFGGEDEQFRSFYFVADKTQSASIKGSGKDRDFVNWYHFFVIHSFERGKYSVTDAVNVYGEGHESKVLDWKGIGEFMIKYGKESGKKAWDHIKNLEKHFKYVQPPNIEVDTALVKDKILNASSFKNLTHDQKRIYIGRRASEPGAFTSEMFQILDLDLKNLALTNLYKPKVKDIIDIPPLAKRYARVLFTRNLTKAKEEGGEVTDLIPIQFIKYLDDAQKEEYYNIFEKKFLNYDLIQKYFGDEKSKQYIAKQAKQLDYIPKKAYPYIPQEYKEIYNIMNQYQVNWIEEVSDSEELTEASSAVVNPIRITYEQYIKIPKNERNVLTKLGLKTQSNNILYSVPTTFYSENTYCFLLPLKVSENLFDLEGIWVIINDSDQVIKKLASINEISINNQDIFLSETPNNDTIIRYHPLNKVKINGKLLDPLQESRNIWNQYSLQRKAGIIK